MKFFELIRQYNNTKFRLKSKMNEEAELRELCALPKTSDMGGMPGAPGYNGSPVEKFVIRLGELQEEQNKLNSKLEDIRNDIMLFIDTLDDYFARQVVELVVFRLSPRPNWKHVAKRIGYSESGARALYKTSASKLENFELEELKR